MVECTICQSEVVDGVHMSCESMHEFCFKCILSYVEKNNCLKECPTCRGSKKYIIVNNINKLSENRDSSLNHFKKSLVILNKITKEFLVNTCVISDTLLLTYIKNIDKINRVFLLVERCDDNLENVINDIAWDVKKAANVNVVPVSVDPYFIILDSNR